MGIYSNGRIYGIKIYNVNDDDTISILYEEKGVNEMTHAQIRESHLLYSNLENKNDVFVRVYMECTSTLGGNNLLYTNNNVFYDWFPISIDRFIALCVS
jgi:hypothetical protein